MAERIIFAVAAALILICGILAGRCREKYLAEERIEPAWSFFAYVMVTLAVIIATITAFILW